MENKNTVSFIRWQFQDCHKSLSFWGFVTVILAVIMLYAGCPSPWPLYTLLVGIAMSLVDAAMAWYRFSRAMYNMEQSRIVRELKNENKSIDR